MDRNYKISDGISLKVRGLNLDLYNNYFLERFSTSITAQEVVLYFRLESQFTDANLPEQFSIQFRGVSMFETSCSHIGEQGLVVEEIGFKQRQDRDLAWLAQDGQQAATDDMIFRIEGGQHLRIAAHSSEVGF